MSNGIMNHAIQDFPSLDQSRLNIGRRLLKSLQDYIRYVQVANQPHWSHVPNRVWRRHSALLVCMHEQRYDRDHE